MMHANNKDTDRPAHLHSLINAFGIHFLTPDRRQPKTLFTIDERGSKTARNGVFVYRLSPTNDKRKLFLTIFDLRSSIVLTSSIAAYPLCF